MESIMLIATKREEALACVSALTDDIKALPVEHQHKLYFRQILMGSYVIFPKEGDKVGDKELIIFPASREEDLERLKGTKNIVLLKNCMYVVGDTDHTKDIRHNIIFYLLSKEELRNDT